LLLARARLDGRPIVGKVLALENAVRSSGDRQSADCRKMIDDLLIAGDNAEEKHEHHELRLYF
jgi:hypothetical protein